MTGEQRPTAAKQLSRAVFQLVEATGPALAEWAERMRPVFEQFAEIVSRPEIRAAIDRANSAPAEQLPCHCLCGKAHPGDRGICDGEGVTTRHFDSPRLGPVDVPLCAPCAAAQGVPGVRAITPPRQAE